MSNPDCHLFVGPTLYRRDGPLPVPKGIRVMPPVERSDIVRLCAAEPLGVIVLVDGYFHQNLAVGHQEIRDALASGWTVWGLSSMGAIRACEMRTLGMRGWGTVYERFVSDTFEDFQDDEVALLHEAGPSYRPLTEPLVHLRAAMEELVRAGHVSPEAGDAAIGRLKSLWYGDRTWERFLASVGPLPPEVVADMVEGFDRFRVKTIDLETFLGTNFRNENGGEPR